MALADFEHPRQLSDVEPTRIGELRNDSLFAHSPEVRSYRTSCQGQKFGIAVTTGTRLISHDMAMTKKPAKKPKRQAKAAPQWYVKEWLKFLGLPQTHLINATGMSKGRISELLSGTERFNADTLEAFAKALNKRPYQLLLPPDAKQARILDLAEGVPEHQGAVVEEFLNALAKKG